MQQVMAFDAEHEGLAIPRYHESLPRLRTIFDVLQLAHMMHFKFPFDLAAVFSGVREYGHTLPSGRAALLLPVLASA